MLALQGMLDWSKDLAQLDKHFQNKILNYYNLATDDPYEPKLKWFNKWTEVHYCNVGSKTEAIEWEQKLSHELLNEPTPKFHGCGADYGVYTRVINPNYLVPKQEQ